MLLYCNNLLPHRQEIVINKPETSEPADSCISQFQALS